MVWVVAAFALLVGLSFVPWAADVAVSRHAQARVAFRLHRGRRRSPPRPAPSLRTGGGAAGVSAAPSSSGGNGHGTLVKLGRAVRASSGRAGSERRKRRGPSLRQLHAVLRTPGLSHVLRRTAQQLVRSLRPRELELTVTLGLGDPFETGRLLALLGPALAVFVALAPRRLQIAPDFDRRRLDVDGVATVVVVPGMLLFILVRALLSRPTLRAVHRLATA